MSEKWTINHMDPLWDNTITQNKTQESGVHTLWDIMKVLIRKRLLGANKALLKR